jgi:[lysine-biosynthesis-protein LysW]---L-2-aminoadipate ligase
LKLAITFDRLRWEEKALKDAASSLGFTASLVDAKNLVLPVPGSAPDIGDAVLQRCVGHYRSLLLSRTLEGAGVTVINPYAVAEVCTNKLATTIALEKARVPTPRTYLTLSAETVEEAAEKLGFPLVMKPFSGSWGRMVTIVRDRPTLKSIIEYKEELANPLEHMYYLQQYVRRPPRDIRIIVAGDQIVASVHRYAPRGEWRTNVARGGTSEAFKPEPELRELVHKASAAVGGGILGVDAMESLDGYLVHEVNNTVEFRGAQSAVKTNIPEKIMRYVASEVKR